MAPWFSASTVNCRQCAQKIENFDGPIIFTRDTHDTNYLESQEGKFLPVTHCVKNTDGWHIVSGLIEAAEGRPIMSPVSFIDKPNFGSLELLSRLEGMNSVNPIESITLVGLCTDICVVSNAIILKAGLPEIPVYVDSSCCAGCYGRIPSSSINNNENVPMYR